MYVADASGYAIRKVDLDTSSVTNFAGLPGTGGATNGIGIAARFNFPYKAALTPDASTLYVADWCVLRGARLGR